MYTIDDIINILDILAPFEISEEWDNVGILVGSKKCTVSKIMCVLDINESILDEAISLQVDCIIAHHPFIFSALKKIDFESKEGSIIRKLIQNDITFIAMHTNLDKASGGINDIICKNLGINNPTVLHNFLRVGKIEPIDLEQLIQKVKKYFSANFIRVIGSTTDKISTLSVCSGSGADFIKQASEVSQVYITADVKFHEAQSALENNLIVLDVGHYNSEKIVIPVLCEYLKANLEDIDVIGTTISGEVFKIL
ncbi:MAG: Nif3-like dinuclear metal center hexameric protein [Epulopiscium sp. Nuni2H_MBin003]|nr:MAG: Nif3-like dinuclear metal center hexameric protein [Epulopiscium sp. Nuni2H_MBin003]